MSIYRLDKLFAPASIAIVGGSLHEASAGHAVLRNLHSARFPGAIHLVNPHCQTIEGIRAVSAYESLPSVPDLAVIDLPPAATPSAVASIGARGTAAAIVLTGGLGHGPGSYADQCERAARAAGVRLVGPNCLGVLVPQAKLNTSFAATMPREGDLALISQSGAIAAGLVQWAATREIGFSAIASIGDSLDVDFGDLLDYFAVDRATRAILLYLESIKDARKFMSAARSAARTKPVLVVKSGRHAEAAKAALTHTGALAGSDSVYDAAFRRAGLLRVFDLDELFAAAETLGRLTAFSGSRLAILTNSGGLGVLAVDGLADLGGELATISPGAMEKLDKALPSIWSRSNPVDICGDADGARYAVALQHLLEDENNDAVLVMNVPTALASPLEAANSIVVMAKNYRKQQMRTKPTFAVWVGGSGPALQALDSAGIPNYATESDAIGGFMHLVRYRKLRDLLMVTPSSLPQDFVPDVAAGREAIEAALRDGRTWSIRSKRTDFCRLMGLLARRLFPRTAPTKPSQPRSLILIGEWRSSSRLYRPISRTSPTLAVCASISATRTPFARRQSTF